MKEKMATACLSACWNVFFVDCRQDQKEVFEKENQDIIFRE